MRTRDQRRNDQNRIFGDGREEMRRDQRREDSAKGAAKRHPQIEAREMRGVGPASVKRAVAEQRGDEKGREMERDRNQRRRPTRQDEGERQRNRQAYLHSQEKSARHDLAVAEHDHEGREEEDERDDP